MWKGKSSKYDDIAKYIQNNHSILQEFEIKLKRHSKEFQIYELRFLKNKSYAEIEEVTNIPTQRITEIVSSVVLALEIFCNI